MTFFRGLVPDFANNRTGSLAAAADPAANALALRRAAWFAALSCDGDAAESLLDRAASLPDDLGEAWFAKALLCLAQDRNEAALSAFRSAAAQIFPEPVARQKGDTIARWFARGNRYGAFQEFYDNFHNDFCVLVACRRIAPIERQGYAFAMDRLCAFLGWIRQIIPTVLKADEALNGPSYWSQANLGHQCWLAEDRAGADAGYAKARSLAIAHGLTPYHFNCGVLVWLPLATALTLDAPSANGGKVGKRDITWRVPTQDRHRPQVVISVGCDRGYFRYFPKLLLSILRALKNAPDAPDFVVHCHIADPSDEQIAFFDTMNARLTVLQSRMRLAFSYAEPEYRERSYYTCLRFFTLPRLLEIYSCGVLILDIDCIIHETFFTNIRESFSHTFSMRKYNFDAEGLQIAGEPWSITAYPLYLSNTDTARRLARFMVRYIDTAYDPSLITNWTIDQCALGQAHSLIARTTPGASVLNLARSLPLVRFPHEFGSKDEFLESGGTTTLENVLLQLG